MSRGLGDVYKRQILDWIVFVVAVLIVLAVGKICERHFMFAFGK